MKIASGPPERTRQTATAFRFSSNPKSGVSFTCRLDQQTPEACRSPKVYLDTRRHAPLLSDRIAGEPAGGGRMALVLLPSLPEATPEEDEDDLTSFTPAPRVRPRAGPLGRELGAPAITARCAIAWEPEADADYYEKNPDRPCWTGSTAKIMTLHGLLWAIKRGLLSLADRFSYTSNSVEQGCTCIGTYATDRGRRAAIDIAQVGEQTTVRDMLYGIAMSAAQPTVSAAELVASIALYDTKAAPKTKAEAEKLEIEFVRDIMRPHAAHAGATNTNLVNEHGGAASLDNGVLPGGSKASARDLALRWAHGIQDSPLFLKVLGLDNYEHTNTTPGSSRRRTAYASASGTGTTRASRATRTVPSIPVGRSSGIRAGRLWWQAPRGSDAV